MVLSRCCHGVLCVLCVVMVQESCREPSPCQGFALLQGFPSQLLEGSSLLTLWLHPYFLGSFCLTGMLVFTWNAVSQ